MPIGGDFLELTTRSWRAKLAVSVEMIRELSRVSEPEAMIETFTQRMNQLYPTTRQLSISRRGLEYPSVRILRYSEWVDRINPYKQPERLPVIQGGLFPELTESDSPQIIDHLELSPDDPAFEYLDGQHSLLSIPIYEEGEPISTVILTKEEPAAFDRDQVPDLVWMCNLFGRAMLTQVLSDKIQEAYQASVYESRVIADLQQSLLPAETPEVPGLDLAVHYRTANRVGGDYYDFFPLADGRLGVLIADVSGHGSPAAVLMAITHSLAHARPDLLSCPGRFLGHLNASLGTRYTGTSGHFVTAIYGVVDVANCSFLFSNAGHLPPRLYRHASRDWQPLGTAQRLPLGINTRQAVYPEQKVHFCKHDRLLLFTDGIVDAANRAGERFGYDQLAPAQTPQEWSSRELCVEVLRALEQFTNHDHPADDQTLLILTHHPAF
jgi:phosphoserine phosphatase RsbU/P